MPGQGEAQRSPKSKESTPGRVNGGTKLEGEWDYGPFEMEKKSFSLTAGQVADGEG